MTGELKGGMPMDNELEETLRFVRLFSVKLSNKTPSDGFAKDYIIAVRCMIDAAVETIEQIAKEEAENDM